MAKKNFVSASEGVLTLGGEGFRGELLLIQPNIALKPHTSYRISFESRSVEKPGNLRVYLQFQKLVDGQAVSETVNDSWKTISPEWAEHEFTIDFPENGRSPWFVINTTGNVSTQIRRLTIKAVEQQETK
ncbi:hypothetical protein SDC9_134908 [bioreactor metagenome]|uniref:CBM-cenC domain-containing protein n=1 Tax=bioreactor metagenome TaxID=1076179 RepID=A0A645DFK5_9ZZZZ